MDLVELRARLRALARDPEEMGRRTGLPVGTVEALMRGELRHLTPEVRDRLVRGLTADPEGEP